MKVNKWTIIIFGSIVVLVSSTLYEVIRFSDHNLHIVFCDVGQGDGIFITTPSHKHILIDGGPDEKILDCLSSHLPFWQKRIDVVFLSHPHADHLNGLISILERYTVLSFDTEKLANKTVGYQELMKMIQNKHIPFRFLFAGDSFRIKDEVQLKIIGPTKDFLEQTSPNGIIAESREFASLETLLSFGSFTALFTGDSQVEELQEAISGSNSDKITLFQVSHHGSKSGISRELLRLLNPQIAVISVGKKNKYGHPAKETLRLLDQNKTKIFRTDQKGSIETVSDGKGWVVK